MTQFQLIEQLSLTLLNLPNQTITNSEELEDRIINLQTEFDEICEDKKEQTRKFEAIRESLFNDLTRDFQGDPILTLFKQTVLSSDEHHLSQVNEHKKLLNELSKYTKN